MTEQQEAELKLLNETINHYNLNNRGFNNNYGMCMYFDSELGYKCAIGRLLTDAECRFLDAVEYGSITNFFNLTDGDEYPRVKTIKNKLSKYSIEFLKWLQDLHDNAANWSPDGLSDIGKKRSKLL